MSIAAIAWLALAASGAAWSQMPAPADMQRAKEFMQKSPAMMTPAPQERAKALPAEVQQAVQNVEQAADAARRIANHRLPRGGLLPYLPLEKVNGTDLARATRTLGGSQAFRRG